MTKRDIKNISVYFFMITYTMIYVVFLVTKKEIDTNIFNLSFILLLTFIAYKLFGFRKIKDNYLSQNITRVVLFYSIISLIILYGMGFLVGFNESIYNYSFYSIINNRLIPIAILILIELFRYIVIRGNKDKKSIIFIYTFMITILEIIFNLSLNNDDFVMFVLMDMVPIAIKNIVLSYLCYNEGYKSPIIYRLIIDTYMLIIPYTPKLDDILYLLLYINLPLIIYVKASKIIDQRNRKNKPIFYKKKVLLKVSIVTFICVVGGLISGLFPHYMIGIKTESMEPTINRGDSVIIEKINKDMTIKKGDIIAYRFEDSIIVHRVIKKYKQNKNDKEYTYVAKGDNNNTEDDELKIGDIEGIIRVKIPIVAWPTIWISEMFNK